jgi:hypothetical protein
VGLVRCDVFSEALSLSTSMTVILPRPTSTYWDDRIQDDLDWLLVGDR